ncbi:hypothetical protein G4B88_004826 [Cannabis sativa]|uniref:Cystatin domain-containing protein n=2 Tax=Cannabis sativa TaxID=3483 RepID=A0A7J6FUY4_CANSA|nr:hypothetical protein G4B88_004826 [Cannabis sativa]
MAMLNSPSLTFSSLTLFLLLISAVHGGEPSRKMVGGRTVIKDVKTNKEIQQLGRFAVEEYNRSLIRTHSGRLAGDSAAVDGELRFSEVVEAQKQVVSGIKYYLKVAAVPVKRDGDGGGGSKKRVFDSVVVVKPWMRNSKQLLDFAPSNDRGGHF